MSGMFPWSTFEPTRADPRAEYDAARADMAKRRYARAAERLEWILDGDDERRYGLADAPELLALSYFHSAQLVKAEGVARSILRDHPDDGWALMLLARTLERQNREDEAKGPRALATALGQVA